MDKKALFAEIQNMKPWGVLHRRHLHAHPELSLQERATSVYCQKILNELGYKITPTFATGFVADLTLPGLRKRIAFRAEMDALPITEQNEHDFISKHAGVAHMCGHDVHMSIALLTAKVLALHQEDLPCNVRFIFQPSEEELPGGALGMIKKGCLEGVDEIYGLHTTSQAEVGTILIREGTFMGTSSPWHLEIKGRGCHAAKPEAGLNPISAAALLVTKWQDLAAEIKSDTPPILTVTMLHSGTANNVVPETAIIEGALRAFSSEDLETIQTNMWASLRNLERAGYVMSLNFTEGYRCVINPKEGVHRVVEAARNIPALVVDQSIAPMRFVEDFCYYLEHKPGAFYFLGGGNSARNIIHPLHSPRYDVDEEALIYGAALMTFLALDMQ